MEGSELQLHRTVAYVDQYSEHCFSQQKASLLRCAVQPPCCAAMLGCNLQGSLPWHCMHSPGTACSPAIPAFYPKGLVPSTHPDICELLPPSLPCLQITTSLN